MANTLKFGNGEWATKEGSTLAYNDENGNFKPLPFDFSRSTSATRVNKQGLIELVSNNEPRIDFLNDSNGALKLEPSRSNLITYSEDFSDASWTKDGTVVTSNNVISPDGSLNAYSLTANDGSNINVYTAIPTSNDNYTYSVFLKKGNTNIIQPYIFEVGVGFKTISTINFDNETATITVGDVTLKKYSNDWFKVSITIDLTSEFEYTFGIYTESTLGIRTVYAWGAQLEVGYATSYIPTQGSISTRVGESSLQGGFQDKNIFGSAQGTVVLEFKWDINGYFFDLNDASNIRLRLYNDNNTSWRIRDNIGASWYYTSFSITQGQKVKIGIKWNGTEVTAFQNGFKSVDTATFSANMAINSITSNKLNNTSNMQFYNTALTDQELQTLTTK